MSMSVGPAEEGDDVPMSDINTTPLVDVMLVLLIIFLITVPVVLQTVPVKLPNVPAGVQNGTWVFSTDTGSVNSVVVTLKPVPAAYVQGMGLRRKKGGDPKQLDTFAASLLSAIAEPRRAD